MNIDDLIKIYNDAFWRGPKRDSDTADHAGIRAVVAALRDEIEPLNWQGNIRLDDVSATFNDILGDAVEKAAGGDCADPSEGRVLAPAVGFVTYDEAGVITKEQWNHLVERTAPAADPSPQCEWTVEDETSSFDARCRGKWMQVVASTTPQEEGYMFCPSCGLPIKFKEPT